MTVHSDRASHRAAPPEASGKRQAAPRSRVRRALAVLGGVIALAATLLLVNQLLVWRALRRLGEGPLRLSYESALSWIPGVVHVKGIIVTPLGSTWSVSAEQLRAEIAVTALLRGALRIHELTANVTHWHDPARGLEAQGQLRIAARGVTSETGALYVDAARLSLESWRMRLGSDSRAVLDGKLRLRAIRAPLSGGALTLDARALRLRARLSRHDIPGHVALLVDGRVGVSEGRLDPDTHLVAALQEPLEAPQEHWSLRVSRGSELRIASRAAGLVATGRSDRLVLRSRASGREIAVLKEAELEPLHFASLVDAGEESLTLRLRATEFELDSGTALGELSSPLQLVATVARHERSGWQMASASLELARVRFGVSARLEPPLRALVRLRMIAKADGATQIAGDVEMEGAQLGALYPLLGVPPPVELMLSPFADQPFSAVGRFDSGAEAISLKELGIRTRTLELRGFLRFSRDEKRGALLIVTPAATIGVSLRKQEPDVVLRPPGDWLERQRVAHGAHLARQSQPRGP